MRICESWNHCILNQLIMFAFVCVSFYDLVSSNIISAIFLFGLTLAFSNREYHLVLFPSVWPYHLVPYLFRLCPHTFGNGLCARRGGEACFAVGSRLAIPVCTSLWTISSMTASCSCGYCIDGIFLLRTALLNLCTKTRACHGHQKRMPLENHV